MIKNLTILRLLVSSVYRYFLRLSKEFSTVGTVERNACVRRRLFGSENGAPAVTVNSPIWGLLLIVSEGLLPCRLQEKRPAVADKRRVIAPCCVFVAAKPPGGPCRTPEEPHATTHVCGCVPARPGRFPPSGQIWVGLQNSGSHTGEP